jgi:actin-like ATPase involved in cell morphogenesis
MNRSVYGVDFGMSNSSVMVGLADGTVVRVPDPMSPAGRPSYQIPTALCLTEDGQFAVGIAAERIKVSRPEFYRGEFKRDLGKGPKRLGGDSYEVYQLVAEVLGFLRDLAGQVDGKPEAVMFTIPATWEKGNQALVSKAAEISGFDPGASSLISEPEAAAAYAIAELELSAGSGNFLIYDFGGGTFDCAIVVVRPDGSDVLGVSGIADLGGSTFDGVIRDIINERHPDVVAGILDDSEPTADILLRRITLRETCERIKIQLSSKRRHSEMLTGLRSQVFFELTRAELEARIKPKIDQTLTTCDDLLKSCGLEWDELSMVVPVGGCCHMPAVKKMLADGGRAVVAAVSEPDLAVVLGAVRLARRAVTGKKRTTRLLPASARLLSAPRTINAIAVSPDGETLGAGCQDAGVREWNLRNGAITRRVRHGYWVTDVAYRPGADARLVTAARDGAVISWGPGNRPEIVIRSRGGQESAYHAAYSPDGRWMVTHRGETAEIRDGRTGAALRSVQADRLGGVAFGPDGKLVTTTRHGEVCLWDAETGACNLRLYARVAWPGADLRDAAISQDGTAVAAACARHGLIWVWDISRGGARFVVPHGHVDVVTLVKLAFSPDGRWLVSAGGEMVCLWDAHRGVALGSPVMINGPATDVTFTPDGRRVAVSAGSTCRILQVADSLESR